jgi:hypothetical protein
MTERMAKDLTAFTNYLRTVGDLASLVGIIEKRYKDKEITEDAAIGQIRDTIVEHAGTKCKEELKELDTKGHLDEKVLDKIKNKLRTTNLTAKLDHIASELEQIDPRLALAVDRISDALEGR